MKQTTFSADDNFRSRRRVNIPSTLPNSIDAMPGLRRTMCPRYCRCYSRQKCFLFAIILTVASVYLHLAFPERFVFKNENFQQACIIPKPNPWHSSILQYIWDLKPLVCDTSPAIVLLDDTCTIQYNFTALHLLNLEASSVKCRYRIVERHIYDEHVTYTSALPLTPPIQVEAEFVHVICETSGDKQIFEEHFACVRRNNSKQFMPESKDQLSLLLFAIDSVSRSHALRKLPKTIEYLTEQLKAYDFQGYMKVGDNTIPNIMAMLTGRRAWTKELPLSDYLNEPYDDCPFIWKNYSSRGYVTLYAEDRPELSSFVNLAKGFKNQPTDHYMQPFWQGIYELDKIGSNLNVVLQFLEDKHVQIKSMSTMCYHRKAKHVVHMEYVKQFLRTYAGVRKFAWPFINELSHGYPNFLGYGDEDVLSFLKWVKSEGHLNNSVLVFLSDHGSRIDKLRNTIAGRIEARMPMMYIVLPEHIKKKFPELEKSMELNTRRLSTPFDLYQTLIDIVNQNFKEPSKLYVDQSLRGVSLFQPLPHPRSCADAWIPESFCACYSSSQVNISNESIIGLVAGAMVDNINERLSQAPQCAQLELFKIQNAELITQGLKHVKTENIGMSLFQFFRPDKKPLRRYLVVIETVPGHAIFEGTADIAPDTNYVSIVGDILRLNKYGEQGWCLTDKRLRPLCYCIDQKTKTSL